MQVSKELSDKSQERKKNLNEIQTLFGFKTEEIDYCLIIKKQKEMSVSTKKKKRQFFNSKHTEITNYKLLVVAMQIKHCGAFTDQVTLGYLGVER